MDATRSRSPSPHPGATPPGADLRAGDPRLPRFRARVLPEWIDGNHHMNASHYLEAIKRPAIELHRHWDYAEDFRARTGESNFVLEARVFYARELLLDDPFVVTARITAITDKTMTVVFELIHETQGYLAALVEYLLVHVRLGPPPKSCPIPSQLRARLAADCARHANLPWAAGAQRLLPRVPSVAPTLKGRT